MSTTLEERLSDFFPPLPESFPIASYLFKAYTAFNLLHTILCLIFPRQGCMDAAGI
jgi:hypothetical protein